MPKRKVLYLITKDDVGGAQKYVHDLAASLNPEQFEVTIVTGGRGGVRWLTNAFRPHFLFINDLVAIGEVFFLLGRERPDVLHLNSSKAGVIGSCAAFFYNLACRLTRGSGARVVFTAHGWVFNPDNDLSPFRRAFYRVLHRLAARFQDVIINVSEYDRALAVRHRIASAHKLVTIYNGIVHPSFLSRADARRAIAKIANYRLPITASWIGTIGRLVKEKDHATLIEAARHVPNAYFFVIGDGYEKQKLQLLITNYQLQNRFFLLGNIALATPYLKAFDIFTLSSIKEGLPYTMVEAMAAELPLVVTRVGGMKEIVEGRGLVMQPREPHELARALNHYLTNPEAAREAAKNANTFYKERLQLERMVSETEEVYLAS